MIAEIILYLLMLLVVVVTVKAKSIQDFAKKLSFKKFDLKIIPNIIKYLLFLMTAALTVGMFFYFIGMKEDAQMVSSLLKTLPLLSLLVSVFLASFIEEIMFRGFLQKRAGILVSSFLFAISHAGYGSVSEMVGAFVLGIILAIQFKKSGNLWNVILTHLLYNLTIVAIVFSV